MKSAGVLLLSLASIFSPFSPARRAARKGVEEFRAKQLPNARRDFREASRREPAEKTWNFDLGTAGAAAEDGPEARRELALAAQARDPAIAGKAHYQLGTLELRDRNYSQAVQELRRSLELEPGNPDAKRNFELALQEQKKPPSSKPRDDKGKQNPRPEGKSGKGPDDTEFRRNAGMTRAEAEAMLRSLENEQKQRERASARVEGKDW